MKRISEVLDTLPLVDHLHSDWPEPEVLLERGYTVEQCVAFGRERCRLEHGLRAYVETSLN